ncbi:hypothetical protein FHS29_004414 [Saccharothrix tamanrassetensis]|uniref:Secreted protein n=1 Tax=Saccharothrix tamanrassetensis TaxID=1051531 RepID=A0A841CKJ5_9PSEU|nr:hypothetical protein [Saccharothrix tamanrassetensis]MBB5957819.1 hypothetical protein [Saccharothrix tamanrassetensis]
MARFAVTAVLLALVAVLTPSSSGADPVSAIAVAGHRTAALAEALSEEDPNRECRKGPEPRAFSAATQRSRHHRNADRVDRSAGAGVALPAPEPVPLAAATDHLRTRRTPSALQVFRN